MTGKTVVAGAVLVLIGVLVGMNVPKVEAQQAGAYAIAVTTVRGAPIAWRINVRTGQASWCIFAQGGFEHAPNCSPWSATSDQ